jgi:hypothetical protein
MLAHVHLESALFAEVVLLVPFLVDEEARLLIVGVL